MDVDVHQAAAAEIGILNPLAGTPQAAEIGRGRS